MSGGAHRTQPDASECDRSIDEVVLRAWCAGSHPFGQRVRVHCRARACLADIVPMPFGKRLEVKPLFIEPGSPWENGYIESFNGKMRDVLLAREIFYSLKEAQILIEMWRRQYNTIRPHSALGYRPPAPAAIVVQPTQVASSGLTL